MLAWLKRAFGRGRSGDAARAEPRFVEPPTAATARAAASDIDFVATHRVVEADELIARVAREAGVMRGEVWTARMLALAVVRAVQERGDDVAWTVGEVNDWISDVRSANRLPEHAPSTRATLAALGTLVGKPCRERLSVEREDHRRLMARAKRRHGEVPERATIYRIGAGPVAARPSSPPAARAEPTPAKKGGSKGTVVSIDKARRAGAGGGGKSQAKGRAASAQMTLPLSDAARPERRRRAA